MDQRFLEYYNQELKHVRESAGEFAQQFPKIAGRLGLESLEVADPYVERLIESFAFLAARVQLKLDAQFPGFTQHLLQVLYPNYQAQKPSAMVVRFSPDPGEPGLKDGYLIPRFTKLRSRVGPRDGNSCEFRTAHDTTLWPIELTRADYFSSDSQIAADNWGERAGNAKAAIKLSLRSLAGLAFNELKTDKLPVYIAGADELPYALHEHIFADAAGLLVRAKGDRSIAPVAIERDALQEVGFDDDQALLPASGREFQGYRLLQEYFLFPQRFLFFSIGGLQRFLPRCQSTELEILLLLNRSKPQLAKRVDQSVFALHCTPAVNLIERLADRISVNPIHHEYEVVVDKTKPTNFEVHSLIEVRGYSAANEETVRFLPFYGHYDHPIDNQQGAFFVTRQEPRILSQRQKLKGARSSYIGSNTYISLVDKLSGRFNGGVKQLGIRVLCTNRDLPLHMPLGQGMTDFTLDIGAPVERIRCLTGPTKPTPAIPAAESNWRIISLLSLNMQTLMGNDDKDATALRELCRLLAVGHDLKAERQIEALQKIEVRPIVRQLPRRGPITYGRGLEVALLCDENGFEGAGAFLLGAVLERFFGRYVSLNTFTELVLKSHQREEIHRWRARAGQKHLI